MIKRIFNIDQEMLSIIFFEVLKVSDQFKMSIPYKEFDERLWHYIQKGFFEIKKFHMIQADLSEKYEFIISNKLNVSTLILTVPIIFEKRVLQILEQCDLGKTFFVESNDKSNSGNGVKFWIELESASTASLRRLVPMLKELDVKNEFDVLGIDNDHIVLHCTQEHIVGFAETNEANFNHAVLEMKKETEGLLELNSIELLQYNGYTSLFRSDKKIYFNNWNCEIYLDETELDLKNIVIDKDCNEVCEIPKLLEPYNYN